MVERDAVVVEPLVEEQQMPHYSQLVSRPLVAVDRPIVVVAELALVVAVLVVRRVERVVLTPENEISPLPLLHHCADASCPYQQPPSQETLTAE